MYKEINSVYGEPEDNTIKPHDYVPTKEEREADKRFGETLNNVSKVGGAVALGGTAIGAGMFARDVYKFHNSPAGRAQRFKLEHEKAKLNQIKPKAKRLGDLMRADGQAGIVRSGGKKYHYNEEGVLTHVEHANGKTVYTKTGAEAQAAAAPKRLSVKPNGYKPETPSATTAETAAAETGAAETGAKRTIKLKPTSEGATEAAATGAKKTIKLKPTSQSVAEAAARQTAIESGEKVAGKTFMGMANNVAGQSESHILSNLSKNTVGDFFKDAYKHSNANSAKLLSLTTAGRTLGGIATNQIHSYLNNGGTWAGNRGTEGMAGEIFKSLGGDTGTDEDVAARRKYALQAAQDFHTKLGSDVGEYTGLAGELVTGGRTFGGLDVAYKELAGGVSNITTSLNGDKTDYMKNISEGFKKTRDIRQKTFLQDYEKYGEDAARYINGDPGDAGAAAAMSGTPYGRFVPDKKEDVLSKYKREQAFGKTSAKMEELSKIEDPAARQAWFKANSEFLANGDLRGMDPRSRFRLAHEAFGNDSERALGFLNSSGEDRKLGIADFIRGQSGQPETVAPNAPAASTAKAPVSPLAQASTQYSPQYSNPNLFGLGSQSPMGGTPQNQMYGNNLFSVNGMPAADWASNMSKQIQNTRIGTKSTMQQGFNNGMWQDSRPMNQRGMGGNAIAQGQADYMNARGMPTAAQWSAFTNDRQARIKNPELYNQPEEEPSIADNVRSGNMPMNPIPRRNGGFSNQPSPNLRRGYAPPGLDGMFGGPEQEMERNTQPWSPGKHVDPKMFMQELGSQRVNY